MLVAGEKSPVYGAALFCGLIYLFLFGVMATVLRGHFGFPLDDSWIHQVMARNLVEYHRLGFIPGQMTSGSTSLLWTAILSLGRIALPGVSPVVFCAGLGAITVAGIGFLLKRITEEDGLPETVSWCLAIAPALSGNFLWLGLIGMEHVLFLLLSLALIRVWFGAADSRGRWDAAWLFGLSLLLELTRPEGFFLIALLVLASGVARRPIQQWFAAAAGGFCGLATVLGVNWKISGRLMPPTMAGRRLFAPTRPVYLFQSWFQVMKSWNYYRLEGYLQRHALAIGVPLFLGFLFLVGIGLWRLWSLRASRFLLLCLWGATIEVLYLIELPTPGHGGRYIAMAIMVCLSLILVGISDVLRVMFRGGMSYRFALATVMVVWAVESGYQWRRALTDDIDQINTEHGAMAEWLGREMPAEDFTSPRVAVFDIGRIGYRFHGNVIDMGALVDPNLLDYFIHHRTLDYLRQRGVQYVVIPGRENDDDTMFIDQLSLDRGHGVGLRMVHRECADSLVATMAIRSSGTAFPCQRLFAIDYGVVAKR